MGKNENRGTKKQAKIWMLRVPEETRTKAITEKKLQAKVERLGKNFPQLKEDISMQGRTMPKAKRVLKAQQADTP